MSERREKLERLNGVSEFSSTAHHYSNSEHQEMLSATLQRCGFFRSKVIIKRLG